MMQSVPLILLLSLVTSTSQHNQQPPPYGQQQQQQHPQGGHGHEKPLQFASEIHNAAHIMEHLQNVIATKTKDQMTEEELEFHYFKQHDYDGNNKLDGVEIGKALTHFHDERERPTDDVPHPRPYNDNEIAEVVDAAMLDDLDGDGYIEYPEFMTAQARRYEVDPVEGMPPGYQQEDVARPPGHQEQDFARPPGHQEQDFARPPGF